MNSPLITEEVALTEPKVLLEELIHLRSSVLTKSQKQLDKWKLDIGEDINNFRYSAAKLANYLDLRQHDLRKLQVMLHFRGLSSLGRIEAQVLQNLDAVIMTLARLCGEDNEKYTSYISQQTMESLTQGQRLLEAETVLVFGKKPLNRRVRMMVTLGTETAQNPELVRQMVASGMNIARINCAHDTSKEWLQMITNVRRAEQKTGFQCKISMDLGGPKSRTGKIITPKDKLIKISDTILLTTAIPKPSKQYPFQIQCMLPEVIEQVHIGAQIWFDDGKIGAIVNECVSEGLVLLITQASDTGDKIKSDKGINFPDTKLNLDALTAKDIIDLDFIVKYADIINYSFVQTTKDIHLIQQEIEKRNPQRKIAMIAKIETAKAIEHLPSLIVAAASKHPFGVMIARGDLAVEIGFERMAEMQEEILWICEAAHTPVIWATQVLETLAKTGRPTRAEMTDAAMAERAECVMLNKGKYIIEAMRILDSVLVRMETHQSKKTAQLRALRSWL